MQLLLDVIRIRCFRELHCRGTLGEGDGAESRISHRRQIGVDECRAGHSNGQIRRRFPDCVVGRLMVQALATNVLQEHGIAFGGHCARFRGEAPADEQEAAAADRALRRRGKPVRGEDGGLLLFRSALGHIGDEGHPLGEATPGAASEQMWLMRRGSRVEPGARDVAQQKRVVEGNVLGARGGAVRRERPGQAEREHQDEGDSHAHAQFPSRRLLRVGRATVLPGRLYGRASLTPLVSFRFQSFRFQVLRARHGGSFNLREIIDVGLFSERWELTL